MDKRTRRLIVGTIGVAAVIAVGAGAGPAAGGGDERPLKGADYDRATTAALEHLGEGTVVETEAGDDGAAYEVEIRGADGTQVEVELDENFEVIGNQSDDDGASDAEDEGDD